MFSMNIKYLFQTKYFLTRTSSIKYKNLSGVLQCTSLQPIQSYSVTQNCEINSERIKKDVLFDQNFIKNISKHDSLLNLQKIISDVQLETKAYAQLLNATETYSDTVANKNKKGSQIIDNVEIKDCKSNQVGTELNTNKKVSQIIDNVEIRDCRSNKVGTNINNSKKVSQIIDNVAIKDCKTKQFKTIVNKSKKEPQIIDNAEIKDTTNHKNKITARSKYKEEQIYLKSENNSQVQTNSNVNSKIPSEIFKMDIQVIPFVSNYTSRKKNSKKLCDSKLLLKYLQEKALKLNAICQINNEIMKQPKQIKSISLVDKSLIKSLYYVNNSNQTNETKKINFKLNPLLIEREKQMKLVNEKLKCIKRVKVDSNAEIKTMIESMKKYKKPTLLSLAEHSHKDLYEYTKNKYPYNSIISNSKEHAGPLVSEVIRQNFQSNLNMNKALTDLNMLKTKEDITNKTKNVTFENNVIERPHSATTLFIIRRKLPSNNINVKRYFSLHAAQYFNYSTRNDETTFDVGEKLTNNDYNIGEVQIKKHISYLPTYGHSNSTLAMDSTMEQDIKIDEIITKMNKCRTIDKNLLINDQFISPILCPTSSDILTRYMNFNSQIESESYNFKTFRNIKTQLFDVNSKLKRCNVYKKFTRLCILIVAMI